MSGESLGRVGSSALGDLVDEAAGAAGWAFGRDFRRFGLAMFLLRRAGPEVERFLEGRVEIVDVVKVF